MRKVLGALALAVALAGCGGSGQKEAQLGSGQFGSGQPEAVFQKTSLREVSNRLIGGCARATGALARTDKNRLECRLPMGLRDAALIQVASGKASPVMPRYILGFTLVEEGADVRVFADALSDGALPFGQAQRSNMMTRAVFNQAMQILLGQGAVLPQDAQPDMSAPLASPLSAPAAAPLPTAPSHEPIPAAPILPASLATPTGPAGHAP